MTVAFISDSSMSQRYKSTTRLRAVVIKDRNKQRQIIRLNGIINMYKTCIIDRNKFIASLYQCLFSLITKVLSVENSLLEAVYNLYCNELIIII